MAKLCLNILQNGFNLEIVHFSLVSSFWIFKFFYFGGHFLFEFYFACPDVYIIILEIYPYFPPGYSAYSYYLFSPVYHCALQPLL